MRWITLSDRYNKSITFNRDNITHVAESEVKDEFGNIQTVIYLNGNACEVVKESYIEVLGMLKAGE